MPAKTLRSRAWFDNPDNIDMTALYLERYLNFGLSLEELRSGKPIIGIAQTGSDLSPVQPPPSGAGRARARGHPRGGRHRARIPGPPDPGDRQAPDRGARPQPRLSRAGRGAVRLSARRRGADDRLRQDHARLPDGGGDGEHPGDRAVGRADAQRLAQGRAHRIGHDRVEGARSCSPRARSTMPSFIKLVASSAPSTGYCNTMGTATTMNSLAEALGMSLPGSAAIPAPYRDRQEVAYRTGKRIVEMVAEDLKPSDILTREAFLNAIVVNSAIGGSTNAPIHLAAIARHIGVELPLDDWQDARPQGAAAGQPAAGGRVSGRGLLPRRRRARGGRAADGAGADPRGRDDRQRPHDRRQLPRRRRSRTRRSSARSTAPLMEDAGLHRAVGQSVRRRDHEDQRDLARVPRALSVQPRRSRGVRRPGGRVRRAGGLSPPDRRSRARHHRPRRCCSCAAPGRSAIRARPRS